MDDYTQALQGGILIGLASWILLAGVGRASAVSSITVGVLTTRKQSSLWRWAFLFGLVGGIAGLALAWWINKALPRSRIWRHRLRMELAPEGDCVQSLHSLQ